MIIALVGNPNCGKTTLFNALTGSTQYVGNWPGVTVEKKLGVLRGNPRVTVADLPGIYSLEAASPDEKAARAFLEKERPDVILNIIDATNLERNLYLTTQLLELGIPLVLALNVMDMVEKKGDRIDIPRLSKELGCPVVPMAASKGKGVREAAEAAVSLGLRRERTLAGCLKGKTPGGKEDGRQAGGAASQQVLKGKDADAVLPDEAAASMRYREVDRLVALTVRRNHKARNTTRQIDRILMNRLLGFPIFAALMWAVYMVSVNLVGGTVTGWLQEKLFQDLIGGSLLDLLEAMGTAQWLQSLLTDGLLRGVGAVLSFLPQIAVLFLILSLLEDCGYMARVAFLMDRLLKRLGLSGKSFIPFLVGTGCSVPAIMASRTIEDQTSRRLTIFLTPFIPCSAKLPLFALLGGAFFPDKTWVAPSMYCVGMGAAIFAGLLLKKWKPFHREASGFVMELPDYRLPNLKSVGRRVWERIKAFVVKAGTIIFIGCGILWFLQRFDRTLAVSQPSESILADLGRCLAPLFTPLGFGRWEAAVAALSGALAKENIVAALEILLPRTGAPAADGAAAWGLSSVFTPLSAYSFMLFNLLAAPCIGAVSAMRKELGSWKWTLAAVGFQTGTAYLVAMLVYQTGLALFYGGSLLFTAAIWGLTGLILWQLTCLQGKNQPRKKSRTAA